MNVLNNSQLMNHLTFSALSLSIELCDSVCAWVSVSTTCAVSDVKLMISSMMSFVVNNGPLLNQRIMDHDGQYLYTVHIAMVLFIWASTGCWSSPIQQVQRRFNRRRNQESVLRGAPCKCTSQPPRFASIIPLVWVIFSGPIFCWLVVGPPLWKI